MGFNEKERQWLQQLFEVSGSSSGINVSLGDASSDGASPQQASPQAASPQEPIERGGARPTPLLGGEGGAAGRDTFVNTQVNKLRGIAGAEPATPFDGDVFRAVPATRADTYNDHSFSRGGRYNKMGDSAMYTSPSVGDVQAEAKNYGSPADPTGIEGSAIVRSGFKGDLLDARSLPDVSPGALKEPYGLKGQEKSVLTRLTGEDPYTMPRAVGDVAQSRNLSGVIAPANDGNANIPLFPEKAPAAGDGALHDGLAYKGQQEVRGGVVQPETVSPTVKPNIPDVTPNRNMGAAEVAADSAAHGRAGGARFGAAGAAAVSLGTDAWEGHFNADDATNLAKDTAQGAVIGQADSMLSGQIAKNLAGAGAAQAEVAGVKAVAGMASAGAIGAVVGGGVAAWHDADKVKDGSMTAGDATADVAVSAGVGLGAGLAGAAAGAAVGSIVPVAGTAVGAVVGFGVGMAASVVATLAAEKSGAADAARKELGEFLTDHVEEPLQEAWHGASAASSAVGGVAKSAAGAVAKKAEAVAGDVKKAASKAADTVEHAAADVKKAASKAADTVEHAAADVKKAASQAVDKAEAVAGEAKAAASKAVDAVEDAAAAAAKKASDAASAAKDAISSAISSIF